MKSLVFFALFIMFRVQAFALEDTSIQPNDPVPMKEAVNTQKNTQKDLSEETFEREKEEDVAEEKQKQLEGSRFDEPDK